jgi:glycosyltransferase involved in cell wall biosynthesis
MNTRHSKPARGIASQRILFLAPLPPPIDGQSKASAQALLALRSSNMTVFDVDIGRSSLERGFLSELRRVLEVLRLIGVVFSTGRAAEAVYLSLSESILGNLKDLLVYTALIGRLDKVIVHMLGGAGMRKILSTDSVLSTANRFFLRRLKGVVVEGQAGVEIFSGHVRRERVHIIQNFADEYLFASQGEVQEKYARPGAVNLLFLSNLLAGKGYLELLQGFQLLTNEERAGLRLRFVGGFSSNVAEREFLNMISTADGVEYLGSFIDGASKRALYLDTHVFCLPTYYPYEGQPISILEAYATGCVVLTTRHAGIPDIFTDQVNGFLVAAASPTDVAAKLRRVLAERQSLERIGLTNLLFARERFTAKLYNRNISDLFRKPEH